VVDGQLVVNGARFVTEPTSTTFGPGTSVEFMATFNAGINQHVGFGGGGDEAPGEMFNTAPWILISTGSSANSLLARINNGTMIDIPLTGSFLGTPHRYRIDWKTSSIDFYVDGTLALTQNITLSTPMRVGVSDVSAESPSMSVDWIRISPYAATGNFTSRVYDGGSSKAWQEAVWQAELPAGTEIKLFQRQGNTPTPDNTWTEFKAIAASGDNVGGTSRYIQYRADLSSSNSAVTPVLQSVAIGCSEPNCPTVAFTPQTGTALPTASVGLAYTQTISTTPSGYKFTATGLPAGLSINETSGVISGTPTVSGNFNVTVTVAKDACTTSANYTLTVNPANTNDSPVLAPITNKTVNVLEAVTFTATATDADGDDLTFTLGGTVPTGAAITPAGSFSWTPTRQQEGTHPFKIVVSDGTATDEEEFTITVNGVNQAPELAAIGNKTVNELATLTFQATATDADVPANTLAYSLGQPETGNYPTGATLSTAGAFSWAPTEAQGPGIYRVKVIVSDGTAKDEEEIQLQVNEVNQAPALAPITNQTVAAQSKLEFTASAQDADLPANTLTFSLLNAPLGAPTRE